MFHVHACAGDVTDKEERTETSRWYKQQQGQRSYKSDRVSRTCLNLIIMDKIHLWPYEPPPVFKATFFFFFFSQEANALTFNEMNCAQGDLKTQECKVEPKQEKIFFKIRWFAVPDISNSKWFSADSNCQRLWLLFSKLKHLQYSCKRR